MGPHIAPHRCPRPTRRRLLRAGAAGAAGSALLMLAGCGTVRLGQPQPQLPPEPGIDELYRLDLLAALEAASAEAAALSSSPGGASETLTALQTALPLQRAALLTPAELEQVEAAEDAPQTDVAPSPAVVTATPAPEGTAAALHARLAELLDLTVRATRQVSGTLAVPVLALGAHALFSADRLRMETASAEGAAPLEPAPIPEEGEITPAREVPSTDLPSGARGDLARLLSPVQEDEWYAAYVREVLAARTADAGERTALQTAVAAHRDRAERLSAIAEDIEGAEVVAQKAVYPLPRTIEEPPAMLQHVDLALLERHVGLVGALVPADRPLSIRAALLSARGLATVPGTLEALPGIEEPEAS